MADDRLDLSPLDPTSDAERFDRIVGAIMDRAADDLRARCARYNPVVRLVEWRRPMLAAAAVLLLLCGGILVRVRAPQPSSEVSGIAEAIGVPTLLAEGLRSDQMPTIVDLFEVIGNRDE